MALDLLKMAKIELLAPGGSFDALRAAVSSGADAVYVGGPAFSARSSAENFTKETLKEATDYCHGYGVDIHVALNTLIKEDELSAMAEYVRFLCEIGVDAIIVQDMAVAEYVKKICPSMSLHASTQMTVTSLEGVRYLEEKGFSRVVLARELSKDEIAYICKNAKAEIEVFVHGAICMSYSGQCLMSSILGGRSGNRGKCAQPCRLMYTLGDEKSKQSAYVLSPKDMSLVENLGELAKIGVTSLKIEGRLKKSEYVSAVTGVYRKYLDNGGKVTQEDKKELLDAFSRSGFTDGYFKNNIGKDMMSHKNPSNAEKNFYTPEAKKRCKDEFYRKIGVYISAVMQEGEPFSVTVFDDEGNSETAFSEELCQKAIKTPLDKERITAQLQKLGNTPFEAKSVDVFSEDNLTIAISEINYARRCATERLWKQRCKRTTRKIFELSQRDVANVKRETSLICQVRDENQLKAAVECGIKTIIVPKKLECKIKDEAIKVITTCPDIFKKQEIGNEDIQISNPAQAQYYKGKKMHGSMRLNVYNSEAAEHYSYLEDITLSPELNAREIAKVVAKTKCKIGIIAYGHLPLMLMKNCPVKAMGMCDGKKKMHTLTDRKNEEFTLLCGDGCISELINSKPVFVADKLSEIPKTDFITLMFTIESYDECKNMINLYQQALMGKKITNPFGENGFTRGHFFRGVL